eukprot:scaffold94636_cov17-Prasinocladus_malaysianus.AAC.1
MAWKWGRLISLSAHRSWTLIMPQKKLNRHMQTDRTWSSTRHGFASFASGQRSGERHVIHQCVISATGQFGILNSHR